MKNVKVKEIPSYKIGALEYTFICVTILWASIFVLSVIKENNFAATASLLGTGYLAFRVHGLLQAKGVFS